MGGLMVCLNLSKKFMSAFQASSSYLTYYPGLTPRAEVWRPAGPKYQMQSSCFAIAFTVYSNTNVSIIAIQLNKFLYPPTFINKVCTFGGVQWKGEN